MKSIFHKLVTKENDFTQLLVNLLERSSEFRASILGFLLPKTDVSAITAENISPQSDLRENGRPDIEVSAKGLCAFIEVKIELDCGLTSSQEIDGGSSELTGYLQALASRPEQDRRLVFLVPKCWRLLNGLEESIKRQEVVFREKSIGVQVNYWEDILDLASHGDVEARNVFVEEFRALLAERLKPILFSSEETHMLFTKGFVDAWQTIWEAQRLVDRIGDKGERLGYNVKRANNKEEYGVYFRNAEGDREFFFGMWPRFSKEYGFPFCYGIQNSKTTKTPDLKASLVLACKDATKTLAGWTMGWIKKGSLESPDPVEAVWSELEPILKSVLQPATRRAAV